jgi:predicted nucleic acid-binding Zn ribbon protein
LHRLRGEDVDLEQAGSGLEKIVAQSLRLAPRAQAPLMAWPVVCGSAVAERTRALSFEDGVLRVEVTGLGWKAELQGLAPRYLAIINRYTTEAVRRIEFVVARAESAGQNPR